MPPMPQSVAKRPNEPAPNDMTRWLWHNVLSPIVRFVFRLNQEPRRHRRPIGPNPTDPHSVARAVFVDSDCALARKQS